MVPGWLGNNCRVGCRCFDHGPGAAADEARGQVFPGLWAPRRRAAAEERPRLHHQPGDLCPQPAHCQEGCAAF